MARANVLRIGGSWVSWTVPQTAPGARYVKWSKCMLENKQPATPDELKLVPQNTLERELLQYFRQL